MNTFSRAFEPIGATQNAVMDGTAKTITLTDALPDRDGSVYVANIGTETAFLRLDGTTPTNTNAMALPAGSAQAFSMPVGKTAVKIIGAAGSTVYVTGGRGA